jgi:predicted negative regulator of RcsB-dependent stress response
VGGESAVRPRLDVAVLGGLCYKDSSEEKWMKKKVKKQLKTDEFANFMSRMFDFFKSNQREFMIAGAAVLFIALVFLSVRYVQAVNSRKQSEILGRILQLESEVKDTPDKLVELEQMAGKGKFGRLAAIKAAALNFERNRTEKAVELLQNIPAAPKDMVYYQARDLLGQIYFSQQQYDEALALFSEIERENPEAYPLDIVLYRKAQVLAARNDVELAIETYTKLQTEFPNSYYGYEATREAQKLEEKK